MLTLDPPHRNFSATHLPALRAYLRRAQRAVGLQGTVSVLLSNDRTLRRLNRDYRGKDKPTDVLSFPAADFSIQPARTPALAARRHAGDLALSLETAARQARALGHPLATEVRILLLHGLLHLVGYDHETDRGEMAEREEQLRRRFRLPTALIARTHG